MGSHCRIWNFALYCMILRSLYDDRGFHIEPEEIEVRGVKYEPMNMLKGITA